ncbi:hypothetical protein [Vibrio alfacsensis]|uniref:hypothetical protein n=1 Tax=Vibrio TaxID=662 RepID=UPI00406870A8
MRVFLLLLIMTITMFSSISHADEDLDDLCLSQVKPKECTLYIEGLLSSNDVKFQKGDVDNVYEKMEFLIKGKFEVDNTYIEDVIQMVAIMDDLVYRDFKSSDEIKDIKLKKEEKYDEIAIEKVINMYKEYILKYPYSRYSSILSLGVNYYSLMLCEINFKNCSKQIPQAIEYVNKVIDDKDETLKGKYYSTWMWYNDGLLRAYLTNIYSKDYESNIAILNKIKSYRYVVDAFGIVFYDGGIVPANYEDQIHIGFIIPGREERLGTFFSNTVVADKLLKISKLADSSQPTDKFKNVYLNEFKTLENDDYLIVVSSLKDESFANDEMRKILHELNQKKYDKLSRISVFRKNLKIVPPINGSYWGVGIGPLTKSEVTQFKEAFGKINMFSNYFLDRPQVIGY